MINQAVLEKLLHTVRELLEIAIADQQKGRNLFTFQDVASVGIENWVDPSKLIVHDNLVPVGTTIIPTSQAVLYFQAQRICIVPCFPIHLSYCRDRIVKHSIIGKSMILKPETYYFLTFDDDRTVLGIFNRTEISAGDITLCFSIEGISWSVQQSDLDAEKVKVRTAKLEQLPEPLRLKILKNRLDQCKQS